MNKREKKAAPPKKKANGYKMAPPIPAGEVIQDLSSKKKWRIGPSIGIGGFGEIYSACEFESSAKKGNNYPFVVKIEPHENGPLFVEKSFYIRNSNKNEIEKFMKENKLSTFGMPLFYGTGSLEFKGEKYRFLVLERYGKDLWSLFLEAGRVLPPVTVFQIGLQMLDVLEYVHNRGYIHADIKGANILMGLKKGTENQTYLVDFGLATRVLDREFKPNPKCAHNGTIEYTSRDAHLGAPTKRGDLEILGYNMLQWIVGKLPWEGSLAQPKIVQNQKEAFMSNVREQLQKYNEVPEALIKFFEYINTLKPKDDVDYAKCRQIFESYLKSQGKTRGAKLEFKVDKNQKQKQTDLVNQSDEVDDKSPDKKQLINQNGEVKSKRTKKVNKGHDTENMTPEKNGRAIRSTKRKSLEPTKVVKVKKAKIAPKATPPVKLNHANIATQTSNQLTRRSPRQVTFDSPICEVIGDKKITSKTSGNSSGDIFDDSFIEQEKKVKPKRKLLSNVETTVKRVVKRKVTVQGKGKSWKDTPSVVNGRSPPK
ncbi:serine/threonine-protein kinase VRK1 [Leptidea sinapis]|uniref:serine/threonine-protein kinase VRK1 n=1 Tax=Leptidea sinapis TaxID=189913 RepID=UPI00211FDBA7|nr:serine/threonine-protein kinase VRK1 [Leptidea sinapis]